MKISVKTMRIGMICINLLLALGFVLHYAHGMVPGWIFSSETKTASVELLGPEGFRFNEDQRIVQKDPLKLVRRIGPSLQPLRPPPPPKPIEVDPDLPEVPDEDDLDADGPIEGGPLATKNWFYVGGILFPDNPRKSRIRLEKREPKGATSSSSSTSRYRSKYQANRSKYSKSSLAQRAGETIEIYLDDYHYTDEDRELDFWVDDVNSERLVYWSKDPRKMYQLTLTTKSHYYEESRVKSLIEEKKEEEDEEDKEKEKLFFRTVPRDFEDKRAEEYEELKAGGKIAEYIEGVDLTARRAAVKSRSSRPAVSRSKSTSSRGSTKSASKKTGSTSSKSSKTSEKKMSNAEAAAKLGGAVKDALKSGKVSEKDKKELRNIEKMFTKPPSRR